MIFIFFNIIKYPFVFIYATFLYELYYLYIFTMNFDCKVVVIDNGTGYTKMGHAGNT